MVYLVVAATIHIIMVEYWSDLFGEDDVIANTVLGESVWRSATFKNPLPYLLYLPAINGLLIVWIGRYALSGILYPYQNSVIKESLDRQNNIKFGMELSHFLNCFIFTLKSQSGLSSINDHGDPEYMKMMSPDETDKRKKKDKHHENSKDRAEKSVAGGSSVVRGTESGTEGFEFLTFPEMKSVIELIDLYVDVNQEVLELTNGHKPKLFHRVTKNMKNIKLAL